MRVHRSAAPAILLAAFALPGVGNAGEFTTIQTEQSRLAFGYRQMNGGMQGMFRKFAVQLSFEPDRIASAKAVFEVGVVSVDSSCKDNCAGGLLPAATLAKADSMTRPKKTNVIAMAGWRDLRSRTIDKGENDVQKTNSRSRQGWTDTDLGRRVGDAAA